MTLVAPVAAGGATDGPADGGGPVLAVEGLTVTAGRGAAARPLVEELSFSLQRGETLAIAGESGSGKSVSALAVMGLLPPGLAATGGKALLRGRDLLAMPERELRRIRGDRVAMIFQEPMTSLNPIMTIGRQLTEAIEAHEPLPGAQARERALAALAAVRLSEPARRMAQHPHELSGGMRQRVMIAMALALKPDVLIADEPTTALDVTVQRDVLDLLQDLRRDLGTAIVLITHDMGVVADMADRVLVMRSGRMVEDGDAERIFAAPREAYTRALLAAVPRLGAGAGRPTPEPGPLVARAVDLTVRYDIRGGVLGRVTHRVHAVEQVSFDIHAGETLALVGESGCGKSTIAKAMAGLAPFEGRLEIAGRNLSDPSARRAARRDAQIVFQDPAAALDPRMRAGDLVAEPLAIHRVGDAAERRALVVDLLARVGLSPDHAERYPHELSGGQRQRLCIARALALKPRLIIADECLSALDVSVQARVLDLLRELKDELGVAYLFISHDLAVVENIADRVAVMRSGRIVEIGPRDLVLGDPRHPYTRRLLASVLAPEPGRRRAPTASGPEPETPIRPVDASPATLRLTQLGEGRFVSMDEAG